MQIQSIPIDQIAPDPTQPRKVFPEQSELDMASSLLSLGQQVPIIVVREGDTYSIIDGEMRWRGAKRAALVSVKAIVLEQRPEAFELLMVQLTVNCMRTDLLPLEKTEGYCKLMEMKGISASELAKQMGVSKAYITRYVSHSKLPENLKEMLRDGSLSSAKAYALSRMSEEQRQQALRGLEEDATRDDFERLAKRARKREEKRPQIRTLRYELPDCTLALRVSKSMTIEGLIDTLNDLLKACRKAKAENIELGTMAMVIRDRTRASSTSVPKSTLAGT